jgi:hypothetical protein
VGTNFQPGAKTGFAGILERFLELFDINIKLLHLPIILLAAFIRQGGIKLFLAIDRGAIAQDSFGHTVYSSNVFPAGVTSLTPAEV